MPKSTVNQLGADLQTLASPLRAALFSLEDQASGDIDAQTWGAGARVRRLLAAMPAPMEEASADDLARVLCCLAESLGLKNELLRELEAAIAGEEAAFVAALAQSERRSPAGS